jgi:hypothetical protein
MYSALRNPSAMQGFSGDFDRGQDLSSILTGLMEHAEYDIIYTTFALYSALNYFFPVYSQGHPRGVPEEFLSFLEDIEVAQTEVGTWSSFSQPIASSFFILWE